MVSSCAGTRNRAQPGHLGDADGKKQRGWQAHQRPMSKKWNIYGGKDPRELAAYTVVEAARYVRIPPQTLRSWVVAHSSTKKTLRPTFGALIAAPEHSPIRLSFNNIVEAYTLRALRTKHGVSIVAARQAMDVAQHACRTDRLFLSPELQAGGGELFLDRYRELVNLTRAGQIAIKHILKDHLARIERDELDIPVRLYPGDSHTIMMDARLAFGRPVIARRGISTAAIVDRINAGETEEEVAEDYGLECQEVKDALVYEQAA